ncbi:protein ASPARTIC PROTEASE IN GUARD CELL 2-like [Panicum miliaceum]|uniref:Protein ASPARTIC PROTEASE IN GUARD CELL 2-like n=1 Tax=Panicum miliaceum TaxID=4540 RepID=A0A3L6Q037_PANMI|nr:protein ASPARTIC PROTEASE IN GUARD CELL 2-like [Panicum miliaceum]
MAHARRWLMRTGVPPLSHTEILTADQRRVQYIHRLLSETTTGSLAERKNSEEPPSQQLVPGPPPPSSGSVSSSPPAMPSNQSSLSSSSSGSALLTGFYVVPIGLGTPTQWYAVALDTGSDMTWVQCRPCVVFCHKQKEPIFSPANSSTYANIPCESPYCSDHDVKVCSPGHNCAYSLNYTDYSYTMSTYGHDDLTLHTDTIKDFRFRCSHNIWGRFGHSAGVMGLGRGRTSLMVQAASKYGGVFAYCLPADPTGTGFLELGPGATAMVAAAKAPARLTPMLTYKGPRYYYVGLTGIKVGGHLLPISRNVFSTAGTLIDSGTVITRLPPSAYRQLRSASAKDVAVLGYQQVAPGFEFLDTCFNLTGLGQGIVPLPTVSLVFHGGASLDVDATGILYVANVSRACLAFAANGRDTDMAVIGSTQQKTYSVMYDIGKKVIGFTPGAC